MKKVSFLVAFLAMMQIAMGQRVQAQQRVQQDRRTVEEALDRAGEDLGQELERLAEELGLSADRMGQSLERWAEENSQELEAWSQKYSQQWESWANRFENKLERLAQDQEGIWQQWAQRYEQDLDKWAAELESDDLDPKHLGEFVERNLEMLSQMPLGQMVDQVLEDGLGELSEAPWESLEELGELAKEAFEEPLSELSEILEEGSNERQALERGARELGRAFDHLKEDVGRNISDDQERAIQPRDPKIDPRIKALNQLRNRDGNSQEQVERIDQLIETIRDANRLRVDPRGESNQRIRIDVPRRDQIQEKIQREKRRHNETLRQFNDELRQSSEDVRQSDERARELDSRNSKRVDGKNLDPNLKESPRSKQDPNRWFQRDGRANRSSSGQNANRNTDRNSKADANESQLDSLRREIEKLRKEVQQLKKETDK